MVSSVCVVPRRGRSCSELVPFLIRLCPYFYMNLLVDTFRLTSLSPGIIRSARALALSLIVFGQPSIVGVGPCCRAARD